MTARPFIILMRGLRGSLRRISSSMARLVDMPVAALKRSTISEEFADSDTVARRTVFCWREVFAARVLVRCFRLEEFGGRAEWIVALMTSL